MKNFILFVKNFLKENKNFVYFAFGIVIFLIFLYLIVPIPEETKKLLLTQAAEYVKNIVVSNQFLLSWKIFVNNTTISLFLLLFGFLLSIWSLLIVFGNIVVIWIVLEYSIDKIWLYKSIFAMLPHGIFEITAIVLTFALSLKLTYLILKKVWNWKETKISSKIKEVFLLWLYFIVPLLFMAAIIETFLTPLFI